MLIAGTDPQENFRNLHAAGCIQTLCKLPLEEAEEKGFRLFCFTMLATRMSPCRQGCLRLWSKCAAYKQYDEGVVNKRKVNEARIKKATTANNGIGTLSVKQIAAQCGTSKSVIRRLKVQGKLNLETFEKLREEYGQHYEIVLLEKP